MAFKCKIGLHSWNGCKCSDCEKTRDEQHDWNGCKCTKCSKIRDEQHDFSKNSEECSCCGKTREFQTSSSKDNEKNSNNDKHSINYDIKYLEELLRELRQETIPEIFLGLGIEYSSTSKPIIGKPKLVLEFIEKCFIFNAYQRNMTITDIKIDDMYNNRIILKIYLKNNAETSTELSRDDDYNIWIYKTKKDNAVFNVAIPLEEFLPNNELSNGLQYCTPRSETDEANNNLIRQSETIKNIPMDKYLSKHLAISFSVESTAYGLDSWNIFWRIILPKDFIDIAKLYCGDVLFDGKINYVIAIESDNKQILSNIESKFLRESYYIDSAGVKKIFPIASHHELKIPLEGIINVKGQFEGKNPNSTIASRALENASKIS
jgi:hypothetical protein